jgi:hypothetical protein
MKKFENWLEERDPEIYNEILGTLALATGIAGAIAPNATGRALKYIAKKGVDVGANVAGHVLKKGIDLGADAIKGGTKLVGKGLYHGAKAAAKGIKGAVAKNTAAPSATPSGTGTYYA